MRDLYIGSVRDTFMALHNISSNQNALRLSLKALAALHRLPTEGWQCAHIL